MAKRKVQSTSSSEEEPEGTRKKAKNSINQSFIQLANFMSKSELLHKSLNLSSSLVSPKNVDDSSSESEDNKVKKTSKPEKKSKVVFPSNSLESENEEESFKKSNSSKTSESKASDSKRKSKSPKKRLKSTSYEAFTPKILPKVEVIKEPDVDNHSINNTSNVNDSRNSHLNLGEDDQQMINSIEEKVQKVRSLQNIQMSPSKNPKQQLIDLYPNLQKKEIKRNIKLHNDDEIFLFRIPKNVDPQNLVNIDIDIEEGGRINIGEKFIVRPTSKIPHPTFVVSYINKILHFKRNIIMEKYTKPQKDPKLPVVEKTTMHMPNNLKNRHPLFGSDFEEKIQLDEVVEKKLDDAIKNLFKQEKKSKKKKIKIDIEDEKDELVFSLLKSKSFKKNDSSAASKPTKKKMSKKNLIEETLKLMKQELHTEYETDSGTSLHKKKKRKKSRSEQENGLPIIKHEKSRKSLLSSTALSGTPKSGFNSELSYINQETSPKKKKKISDLNKTKGHSKKLEIKEEPDESFIHIKKKKKKGT